MTYPVEPTLAYTFENEVEFIVAILSVEHSLQAVQSNIRAVELKVKKATMFGPEKCPVYLKLTYTGRPSNWFRIVVQISLYA